MARARNLKPGFFTNGDLLECQPLARLLFAGLWCEADRRGILEDRPKTLKIKILPGDNCDIEGLLSELEAHGFIRRYQVAGVRCILIPNFAKHQHPHINEQPNTLPAPEEHGASTVQAPEQHQSAPAESLLPHTESLLPSPPPTARAEPARAREAAAAVGHSTYEQTLNGHLTAVVERFQRIDKQYTRSWFRSALLSAEATLGPLSLPELGKGIDLTLDGLEKTKAAGKAIASPRPYAERVLVRNLSEQKAEHHAA